MVSERAIEKTPDTENPLNLKFVAHKFGPYANRLEHLLNNLDGSYLHCDKRISDAGITDVIWFDQDRKTFLQTYLKTEAKEYSQALERTAELIDGFESPFGMELLATVDWLLIRERIAPTIPAVRKAMKNWDGGAAAAVRKNKLFDDQALGIAIARLTSTSFSPEIAA